jgi:uncharacterized membrane protein YidH (DUF202 family)
VGSVRAWVGVALVPVGFLAAVVLAHVVETVMVDNPAAQERSVTADLIGLVLMSLGALLPALAAWHLGRRAEESGNRRGRWPRLAGAALAALAVLWVLASILTNAATGRYA